MAPRKIFLLTCIFILIFFTPTGVQSAPHYPSILETKQFNKESGLPHQHVYQVFQDNKGILWVLTAYGLSIFDGANFHTVKELPLIEDPWKYRMRAVDNQDRLWFRVQHSKGNALFYVNTFTRKIYDASHALPVYKIGNPVDITVDIKGNILIINQKEEIWRKSESSDWIRIADKVGSGYTFLPEGKYTTAIWIFRNDKNNRDRYLKNIYWEGAGKKEIPIFELLSFQATSDGAVWFLTKTGSGFVQPDGSIQWIWQKGSPEWNTLQIKELVTGTYDEKQQKIWLLSNDHLHILHLQGRKAEVFYATEKKQFIPSGGLFIYCDRQKIGWIAGLQGLTRIQIIQNNFQRINWIDPASGEDYFKNSTRGITEAGNGKIYMSSGRFLYAWDPREKSILQVTENLGISALTTDLNDGSIWGTSPNLYNLKPPAKVKDFKGKGNDLKTYAIPAWAIIDLGTQILASTDAGMYFYDKATNRFKDFDRYNGFNELRNNSIFFFHPKGTEKFWLLSNIGLYEMDVQKGVQSRLDMGKAGREILPAHNFRHLLESKENIIWFATDVGLLKWNRTKNQSRLYTTQDGLSSNNLYAVYADDYGHLWINSDNGIMRFHPPSGSMRYFFEEDGITHNEGNRISHFKAKDGTIYFGGLNGVTAFHPKDFNSNPDTEKAIDLLLVSATLLSEDSTYNVLEPFFKEKRIVIRPKDRFFNLQIALPDMRGLTGVTFRYKLEGFSSKWISTRSPIIQFVGIPPGKYTLRVTAKTRDGYSPVEDLVIPITVIPPFYKNLVFQIFAILSILIALRLIFYFRLVSIKNRQKLLENEIAFRTAKISEAKKVIEEKTIALQQRDAERSNFFANVTHEFRTPISLILGPVKSLLKQENLKKREQGLLSIIQKNAIRLLNLADDILMLASLDTHKIKIFREPFHAHNFFNSIIEEFQEVAGQKGLTCIFQNPDSEITELVSDQRLLRIILNNLISNAVKFTPAGGEIILTTHLQHNETIIQVTDTGAGVEQEDLPHIFERYFQTKKLNAPFSGGTGIGLALVRELTELMGGSVTVESKRGIGSSFTLHFPNIQISDSPKEKPGKSIHKADKDLAASASSPFTKWPHIRMPNQHLLLVEDDPGFLEFLEYLLGDKFQLVKAKNGLEAVQFLESGLSPALIITDLMMPEMDGYQFIQYVKNQNSTARIPILVITARAGYEDYLNLIAFPGVDDYLVKPFDEEMLYIAIETLIERSQIRQEHQKVLDAKSSNKKNQILNPKNEKEWLKKLHDETTRQISNELFTVDQLAFKMLMGRSTFFNEVKRLTGLTPNQYILEIRLLKARNLIDNHPELSLKEIRNQIGLKDNKHFANLFKKRFGNFPSHFK